MEDNNNVETRDKELSWLFPELLTNEGLIEFLKQRYVEVPEWSSSDREKLLELYYSNVVPLPQRKYRLNRRGREMRKKQILHAKKRKITAPSDSQPQSKIKRTTSEEDNTPFPRFMTSANISTGVCERTEPPKSMINFDRKIIKLNTGRKTSVESESNKGSSSSADSADSKPKTISLKGLSTSSSLSAVSSGVKMCKLKCTESVGCSESSSTQSDSKEVGGLVAPKKKIKRISWP